MDRQHIKIGKEYAIREPVAAGVELQRVKVLEHVRAGRWRVQWIDPNPGLVDYITSKNVITPWGERRPFLRDEDNEGQMKAALKRSGYPGDEHPLASAVHQVLDSAGERSLSLYRGELTSDPDALERIAARAQIAIPTHPAGYIDRHGHLHLPFENALVLAEALARSEPRTVLDPIDADERDWARQLATEPSSAGVAALLTKYRASWALIRQWAGLDAAIAVREERIVTLERFLSELRWDLRQPDPKIERLVNRIERVLR